MLFLTRLDNVEEKEYYIKNAKENNTIFEQIENGAVIYSYLFSDGNEVIWKGFYKNKYLCF